MHLMTLREICNVTKVSRRAIQGYEKAGLVKAVSKNNRGYLLYDEKGKQMILKIKLFQDMGFSIKEIQFLMNASKDELAIVLLKQTELLKEERRRIDNMIQIAKMMMNE